MIAISQIYKRALTKTLLIILVHICVHGVISARKTQDQGDPPTSSAHEIDLAKKMIKQREYLKAIDHLEEAYRYTPSVAYLYLMARLYDRLNDQCPLAQKTWSRVVHACVTCPLKSKAKSLSEASRRACTVDLDLDVQPPEAQVYLNGRALNVSSGKIKIPAQSYSLRIVHQQKEIYKEIKLKRGQGSFRARFNMLNFRGSHASSQNPPRALTPSAPSSMSAQPASQSAQSTPSPAQARVISDQSLREDLKLFTSKYLQARADVLKSPGQPVIKDDPFFVKPEDRKHSIHQTWKTVQRGSLTLRARMECQYLSRRNEYHPLKECDGLPLRESDRLRFEVEVNQPVYLYLIVTNHSTSWQLIYPMLGESNYITQRAAFYMPESEWLLLDNSKQTIEDFSVIVSRRPIQLLEQNREVAHQKQVPREVLEYMIPVTPSERSAKNRERAEQTDSSSRSTSQTPKAPDYLTTSFQIFRR